jgi:ABC-2 type transport system ATP-binding protein
VTIPASARHRDPPHGARPAAYAVETRALCKTYRTLSRRVEALRDVDLRVPWGAAFGLLGPNGAGKSTLVKTLLSIVRPSAGAATLLGRDISRADARRGVGYLPENHRFPRYLTGRGVCEYFGRLGGLHGAELRQEVEAKIASVKMSDWADTKVSKYSKGMLQRIGIAQAMLGKPHLVFLDEPTDGLDPLGRHQMRELIRELGRSGTTVFINSHLLLEVEQVCDQVAIMHQGRVLRQGTLEEIRATVTQSRQSVSVKFTTTAVDAEARAELQRYGPYQQGSEGFTIMLGDQQQIPEVIDKLRERAIEIYAVEPSRANLEDAFLDLIQRTDESEEV